MEITNSDPNMVICGIRVLLGSQDVGRAPSFVEVSLISLFCSQLNKSEKSIIKSILCNVSHYYCVQLFDFIKTRLAMWKANLSINSEIIFGNCTIRFFVLTDIW